MDSEENNTFVDPFDFTDGSRPFHALKSYRPVRTRKKRDGSFTALKKSVDSMILSNVSVESKETRPKRKLLNRRQDYMPSPTSETSGFSRLKRTRDSSSDSDDYKLRSDAEEKNTVPIEKPMVKKRFEMEPLDSPPVVFSSTRQSALNISIDYNASSSTSNSPEAPRISSPVKASVSPMSPLINLKEEPVSKSQKTVEEFWLEEQPDGSNARGVDQKYLEKNGTTSRTKRLSEIFSDFKNSLVSNISALNEKQRMLKSSVDELTIETEAALEMIPVICAQYEEEIEEYTKNEI